MMPILLAQNDDVFGIIFTVMVVAGIFIVNIALAIKKNREAEALKREGGMQPHRPRKSTAKAPGQQVSDFLRELTGKTSPSSRETYTRPSPQTHKPVSASKHTQPTPVVHAASARHRHSTTKRHQTSPANAGMETGQRTVKEVAVAQAQLADAADVMESRLPKNLLKRAIVLREILGPCRAARPYNASAR